MPRFLFQIQYDGERFYGWQRQANDQLTVQEVVEDAAADLVGKPVILHSAGRTDRGVHARAMPAHVDLETRLRGEELRRAIDVRLPDDVALLKVEEVEPNFHCRYMAQGKCYAYRWHTSRRRSPMVRRFAHFEPRKLELAQMREAAAELVGTHDFAAFATLLSEHEDRLTSKPDPDNPEKPVGNTRTIYAAELIQRGELLTLLLFGDGFLRGMVRGIAGTLIDAGLGKLDGMGMQKILRSQDRRQASANLPACGLTLEKVFYEPSEMHEWIARAKENAHRVGTPLIALPPELA